VEWIELAGSGVVYSFTVVRRPLHADLEGACPYVSAVIELDGTQGAGARMLANIIDCDPGEVRIGTRVEVVWCRLNDEMSIPRFRPVA
jgi:uncharacterized OB-fold protein